MLMPMGEVQIYYIVTKTRTATGGGSTGFPSNVEIFMG